MLAVLGSCYSSIILTTPEIDLKRSKSTYSFKHPKKVSAMTLHTTPFNLTISFTSFTNSFGAKRFQKVAITPHFASRSKRIIRFHSHPDKTDHHFPVIRGSPLKNPLVKGGRVFFPYVVKEISNVMVAMVDLPGLGKEDLTVWIEGKSVRIKGEDAEGEVNYDGAIEIPLSEGEYKEEEIWAVMEKGILQVVIPKMGFVEKKGITNIPIF